MDRDETEEVVEDEEVVVENSSEDEIVEPETDQVEGDADSDDEDEERVVTIGDPDPEEDGTEEEKPATPGWIKTLRKVNRKQESRIKSLERELEARSTSAKAEEPPQLGPEPTLKSCSYDQKVFAQKLLEHHEQKKQVEAFEVKQKEAVEGQQKRWEQRRSRYTERKTEHGFKDFGDAEELVTNTFDVVQQGIIIQGAEDSALVVYALGKNPKKLEELVKVTDPVEFAVAIGKLESQLKVSNRKAPSPEKRVTGKSSGLSGSADATLERLREQAAKTGDYTKVRQYKANRKE